MSKETELSDKAIKDMHQYHYGVERYLKFARAVIAADRELRRGDAGMPVICHALEWTFDGEERGMRLYDDERHCLFDSQSDGGVCSPLVRQSDAQAALAVKDAELAEMKDDMIFVERWANHHGQKPHTTAKEALSCIQHYPPIRDITRSYVDGKVPETRDPYAELAAQAVEIEGLRWDAERYRKDALRAATVAFGLVASSHPKELPQDAGDLAGWLDANVLADFSDDEKPEELFIYIIRAAIAKEVAK